MSFFLKALGFAYITMAAVVILAVILFVWIRHGLGSVGGLFALDGGLSIIVLAVVFAPSVAMLLTGYWIGRRIERTPAAS
jgi:hypothetical protein